MDVLLVALAPAEHRRVAAVLSEPDLRLRAAGEDDAGETARTGDAPAAVLISARARRPIGLAQALAQVDRDMAVTILADPEDVEGLRRELRFSAFVTPNTVCRCTDELEAAAAELAEAGRASVRRRLHGAGAQAAGKRVGGAASDPFPHAEALGRLVETAPVGILTLDSMGATTGWNRHAAAVLGVAESAVIGRTLAELFDVGERRRLDAFLLQETDGAQDHRPSEPFRRIRDGREQFLELTAGPTISDRAGPGTLIVLSDVTERIELERARRRAEQAQAFLAETGALLDASLDPMETLETLAALAIPRRADLCVIDRLDGDGTTAGTTVAATDPEVAQAVRDLREHQPLDTASRHPAAGALSAGLPRVINQMTDETYQEISQGEEHLALMRRLRYRSCITAPLTARGRTFGAISLVLLRAERGYTEDDLPVLQDVARRAALALDNARLYARERRIAETLQRSMLPARLPDLPGVAVAAHYEPGEGDVGGDWYDVIPLKDGRLACVVGDIVGHGIEAASVMGQLRNAVRVYALERDGAAAVVNAVDGLSESLSIGRMATLSYLVIDPQRGTVELCSAGHPPPLLVGPAGDSRYLMGGRSGPVGVGLAGRHTAVEEPFPPGSTIVMYTDGLIERRGESLDEGFSRLRTVVTAAGHAGTTPMAAAVMRALRPDADNHPDDVALLVLQAAPVGGRLSLALPAEPSTVPEVRHALQRWLGDRLDEEELYDVLLAITEACANAVEHAYSLRRGTVEFEAELDDDNLRLVIRDFGRWRPEGASQRGRGTAIMRAVMDHVDVTSGADGTEIVLRRKVGG